MSRSWVALKFELRLDLEWKDLKWKIPVLFRNKYLNADCTSNKEILDSLIESNEIKFKDVKLLTFHNLIFSKELNYSQFQNLLLDAFDISTTQLLLYYDKKEQDVEVLVSYIFFIGFVNRVVIGTTQEIHKDNFSKYLFKYCTKFNYAALYPIMYEKHNREYLYIQEILDWYHQLLRNFINLNTKSTMFSLDNVGNMWL